MMHVPHDLREEFPQEASLIERLIKDNYQFRRLAERYDEVNREIYRIEFGRSADHRRGTRTAQEAAPEAQGRDCRHPRQGGASNVRPGTFRRQTISDRQLRVPVSGSCKAELWGQSAT